MDQDTLAPPPEARLIRVAREATGMTAGEAAKASNGVISAAYWRDVERGYGGRRGVRAATRASARLLAHMARIVRVSPERLETEGERPDGAAVLREILRSDSAPHLSVVPGPPPCSPISEDDSDEEIERKIAGDEMLGYFWQWLKPDGSGLRPRSERIAWMNRWLAGAPSGADERSNGTTA